MKKIFFLLFTLLSLQSNANSEETYMFGGAKLFNYGIEKSDLQAFNTSLVALGFSSSASSTDNSGIGFDIGIGVEIAPNFSIEGSYVNYGTLEIKTNTTGPTENITTEITGDGIINTSNFSPLNTPFFFSKSWLMNSAMLIPAGSFLYATSKSMNKRYIDTLLISN